MFGSSEVLRARNNNIVQIKKGKSFLASIVNWAEKTFILGQWLTAKIYEKWRALVCKALSYWITCWLGTHLDVMLDRFSATCCKGTTVDQSHIISNKMLTCSPASDAGRGQISFCQRHYINRMNLRTLVQKWTYRSTLRKFLHSLYFFVSK